MAYTQKLYNEYKVSDLTWVKKVSYVYGVSLDDIEGNGCTPALNLVELSKFRYQGDSKINGYIYPNQYFIRDGYLWINFYNTKPEDSDAVLQIPMTSPQTLGYSSDQYILSINSRTNNATYITDSQGSTITESSQSKAPYSRTWMLNATHGIITIHNPGVATITCVEFSGSGSGGGSFELTPATSTRLGGVKIGGGINVTSDGTISVTPGAVELATKETAGVVKVGSGLSITEDGTLSVVDGESGGDSNLQEALVAEVFSESATEKIIEGTGLTTENMYTVTPIWNLEGVDIPPDVSVYDDMSLDQIKYQIYLLSQKVNMLLGTISAMKNASLGV
jgi:hypothetical protein